MFYFIKNEEILCRNLKNAGKVPNFVWGCYKLSLKSTERKLANLFIEIRVSD